MESTQTWVVKTPKMDEYETTFRLHICIDLDTQEILVVELTGNDEADANEAKKIQQGKTKNIENDSDKAYLKQRNAAVNSIDETSRDEWKEKTGYHKRSLNEVVMYRYKTIFGEKLSARNPANQITEVRVNCKMLNVYCDLGMPVSYKVD
jgi:hypothetical protein